MATWNPPGNVVTARIMPVNGSTSLSTATNVVSPQMRNTQEPTDSKRSLIRSPTTTTAGLSPVFPCSEDDYAPGLYVRLAYNAWKCLSRTPSKPKVFCGTVLSSKHSLKDHINRLHAAEKRELIRKRSLGLQRAVARAVAIPKEAIGVFVCELPDCGYLKKYGMKCHIIGYQVDRQKQIHIRDYHRLHESGSANREGKV